MGVPRSGFDVLSRALSGAALGVAFVLLAGAGSASAVLGQPGTRLTGSTVAISGPDVVAGFGHRVALSADGTTALVGCFGDAFPTGSAYVFTRKGSTWTQQGGKLTPSDATQVPNVPTSSFGRDVGLSADGNTAVIGGLTDNGQKGAAWVFTRSGSTWTQDGPKLTPIGGVGRGVFGEAVAISGDGRTALIGGSNNELAARPIPPWGAGWVFVRNSNGWAQQGSKLLPSDASRFGSSAALSSDGNTAVIGGSTPGGTGESPAAWVYRRTGSTWAPATSALPVPDVHSGVVTDVALSSAGDVALAGGHVFVDGAGGWKTQATLGPTAETLSVALSADGKNALIGSLWENTYSGAVWLFKQTGASWVQDGAKLSGSRSYATFGEGVALSSDGKEALVGSPHTTGVGEAWVFTVPAAKCTVPKVVGKSLSAAKSALKRAHCGVGKVTSAYSAKVTKGRVSAQSKRAGSTLPPQTKVNLAVSRGRKH